MPETLTRCVRKVSRKYRKKGMSVKRAKKAAWGTCVKSTGLKPHKRKRR